MSSTWRPAVLLRNHDAVALSSRQFDLLHALVASGGRILSKDQLIQVGWPDVAVSDNSLEQAISGLRRTLADPGGQTFIETAARRGYRFAADVIHCQARESDAALDALLAPHRAWIEGRAALETLEQDEIVRARTVFEEVLVHAPDQASARVGLANALVMRFEMTRTDVIPDREALSLALQHARDACRLDAGYGEAWATLGFVLDRSGQHADALAACRRAVSLEPDNWRHHVRLASVSWGEERLRASRRTLTLLPGCPLAHWLAATVHVARQASPEADRTLREGIVGQGARDAREGRARFSGVGLHWLLGLVHLAQGDEPLALESFERELANEPGGHVYARECCANTWYAIGAVRLRNGAREQARDAFAQALARLPQHVMARLGIAAAEDRGRVESIAEGSGRAAEHAAEHAAARVEAGMARAFALTLAGRPNDAAAAMDAALGPAPPGGAGWILPVEPLLRVTAAPGVWAPVLARLRRRAA